MFALHNRNYLCIVDYHSKFPVIKIEHISVNSLILTYKIFFFRIWLSKEKISDSGGNFISDIFKTFCRSLNIGQASLSSYHHQSNGPVEGCIKCIKQTLEML